MTTIAANLESMSGDTLVSWGARSYYTDKIIKVEDRIYGFAGDLNSVIALQKWIKGGRVDLPSPKDMEWEDLEVLILDSSGLYYMDKHYDEYPLNRGEFAIGTGSEAAMGAMMCGAAPDFAVYVASQLDPGTSGDVQTETLS